MDEINSKLKQISFLRVNLNILLGNYHNFNKK